jgi:hypothetical protein
VDSAWEGVYNSLQPHYYVFPSQQCPDGSSWSFGIRLLKKPSATTDRISVIHWGTGLMMTTHGNGSITLGKTDCIIKWGMGGSFGLRHKEGDVADSTGATNSGDNRLIQFKDYIELQSVNTTILCS